MHLLKGKVEELTHDASRAIYTFKMYFCDEFSIKFLVNPQLHKIWWPCNLLVFFDNWLIVKFYDSL